MKKKITLMMIATLSVLTMTAQQVQGCWNSRAEVTEHSRVMCGGIAAEPTVVVEEDFSLFTAGSEANPDDVDITTSNYFVKSEYTHVPNWIGYNVYQAGGACALLEWSTPQVGTEYGHISTPERELYGEVTLTFRARRAHSNPHAGEMWVSLCNNTTGILVDTTFTLKDEWQDCEWTLTNTDFSEYCIFQLKPRRGEVLVDDIKVVRNRTIIPSVSALSALNNSETEFVARWSKSELPEIEGYLLNVYYKDMPEECVEPGSLEVDFESINVLSDNKSIDTSNPGYPEGWTINVASKGTVDVTREEGFYNSGRQAIYFDAAGDVISSPITPAPVKSISFWVRPSNMTREEYDISMVGIQVKNADGKWERIANVPNYWMQEEGGYYEMSGDEIGERVYQVEILCESSFGVQFAIDDIRLDYEEQPVPYPFITDKFVADTFCVVKDIDPTKEFYYNVRVKEGDIVSQPSNDMWVDGLIGVVPTALPASDITPTSFTANWMPIHTASEYKLRVDQTLYTTEADQKVVLVHEDFSNFTEGSFLSPYDEWTKVYNTNDVGRTELEWIVTSPQWVKGMLGSRGTHATGLAGLVVGPKMQLGNHELVVELTARNSMRDDKIWVMLIEEYSSAQAVAAEQVVYGKVATKSDTVVFDAREWGDTPLRVAFMSESGKTFYVDEVTVSCRVSDKGTPIVRPYKSLLVTETSCTFGDIPDYAPTYAYNVTARRIKNFVEYVSEPSETVVVTLPTSIADVNGDDKRVYVAGDELCVEVATASRVAVYSMQGTVVTTFVANAGVNRYTLSQGVYLVKVEDSVYKVIVR